MNEVCLLSQRGACKSRVLLGGLERNACQAGFLCVSLTRGGRTCVGMKRVAAPAWQLLPGLRNEVPHPTGSPRLREKDRNQGSSPGPRGPPAGTTQWNPLQRVTQLKAKGRGWEDTRACAEDTLSPASADVRGGPVPALGESVTFMGDAWSERKSLHPGTWFLPNFQLNQPHSGACQYLGRQQATWEQDLMPSTGGAAKAGCKQGKDCICETSLPVFLCGPSRVSKLGWEDTW